MDLPRAHATFVVAFDPPAPAVPPRVREFWLLAVEPEPEPDVTTPAGTTADAGTRPASRSAVHAHWVEATFEPPHAGPKGTRARPYALGEVLAAGPVAGLLAQEFLDAFAERDALLALQAEVDAERNAADATRWDAARRDAIERAQRRLEDALARAPFPHRAVLTVLAPRHKDALERDFRRLTLPKGIFVDATHA